MYLIILIVWPLLKSYASFDSNRSVEKPVKTPAKETDAAKFPCLFRI